MIKLLVFLPCLFLFPLGGFAQSSQDIAAHEIIVFTNTSELIDIGQQVYFLEDKGGKLTIEDIQKTEYQQKFKKSHQDVPTFGSTSSKIWIQLTVANQSDERIYLEVASVQPWYIDFYKPDAGGSPVLTTQTGVMRPIKSREVDNNFFLFELPQNSPPQTYYFSIQSDFQISIPLHLGSKASLMVKSNFTNWFFGIFWGWVIVMIIYNLFLAYFTRDNAYWYYVGYLFLGLFAINTSANVGYQYNIFTYFPQYYIALASPYFISVVLFIVNLLSLPKNSSLYRVFAVWIVFLFILSSINLWTGRYVDLNNLATLSVLVVYFYILGYSIYLQFIGHPTARYVVYGFSFYLLFIIVAMLQILAVLPSNFFTMNASVFGTELEIIMFSLALGDRMNQIRKQKEQAQKSLFEKTIENEKILKEQNEVLERKVMERTNELSYSNEELNTAVEELSLTLEVLAEQKKTIEVINRKITGSIAYAQTIQDAVLPDAEFLSSYIKDYFLIFRPKDIVSGDFYWIHPLKDSLIVVVADCTGHGVAGSFMSLIGINLLYNIEDRIEGMRTGEIISHLNQHIEKVLKQEKRGSFSEGMDMIVCKIHHKRKDEIFVEFSGAKRMLYFRKNEGGIQKLDGDRKSVGSGINPPYSFSNHELTFSTGDILYLCTDGLQDQNCPNRKKLGSQMLIDVLNSIHHKPSKEQQAILEQTLENHQQEAEQRDDITFMGIRLS